MDGAVALIGDSKTGQPHRLPLSRAALAIINAQSRQHEIIFVSPKGGVAASAATNWHRERDRFAKASGVFGWT